jgi:ABC-type microcin C transport system duplicated ATPase subunit YejF
MVIGDDLLIEVKELKTQFFTNQGVVKAVDGANLRIRRGKTLARSWGSSNSLDGSLKARSCSGAA